MARIRTIKPEFFTSADVCGLSPLARLLYIATWCEADRDGRLVWNMRTLKIRYLPEDNCDIDALADELTDCGLVVVYEVEGKALAWIPTFLDHQHVNPREGESRLPAPSEGTRQARVSDASVTRREEGRKERKGKEHACAPDGGTVANDQDHKAEIREAAKRGKAAKVKTPSEGGLVVLTRMAELSGCQYGYSKALEARLREGVPVEDCLAVVEHLARDPWWLDDDFKSAEAPFREDKFPSYLAKARSAKPRTASGSGSYDFFGDES